MRTVLFLMLCFFPYWSFSQEKKVDSLSKWEDVRITRDEMDVKELVKLGEVSGRSPFYGITAKKGVREAEKKIRQAAFKIGGKIVFIKQENTFGVTEFRGYAYTYK